MSTLLSGYFIKAIDQKDAHTVAEYCLQISSADLPACLSSALSAELHDIVQTCPTPLFQVLSKIPA